MTRTTKILVVGGVASGLALWWWWSQSGAANASLAAHTPQNPIQVPGPPQLVQDAVTQPSPSGGSVAIAMAQQPAVQQSAQMTALLNWAETTKNPALYQQMITQLSPADLASLYNILTTYWAGTTPSPTAAQTSFWNYLRGLYPFLNTGGVGCNNFTCT